MTRSDATRMAQTCLSLTDRLIERYPARIAGSAMCRGAATEIARVLRETCSRVAREPFILHPRALWLVGRVLAVVYVVSMLLGLGGGWMLYPSWGLVVLGLTYGLVQYVFYGTAFDSLVPKSVGCNVSGTIEPAGEVRQQIVIAGHHDSPYVFTFLERLPGLAMVRLLLGILSVLVLLVVLTVLVLIQLSSNAPTQIQGATLWLVAAGLPFAIQLLFLITNKPSPGAGDNLNATSMAVTISQYLASQQEAGQPLVHTRVVLLSTDGEEIGQRGAGEFVRRHRQDLTTIPTSVVNIDSVYRAADLMVLTRDRNSTLRLSADMAGELSELARSIGVALRVSPLPFGGGGTDAGPFARAGVRATSIIGVSTAIIGAERTYHTSRDLTASIDPEAVADVLWLVVEYVRSKDAASHAQTWQP
jgi:aminopeptidase YwaD